jgi:hypothetical protein
VDNNLSIHNSPVTTHLGLDKRYVGKGTPPAEWWGLPAVGWGLHPVGWGLHPGLWGLGYDGGMGVCAAGFDLVATHTGLHTAFALPPRLCGGGCLRGGDVGWFAGEFVHWVPPLFSGSCQPVSGMLATWCVGSWP